MNKTNMHGSFLKIFNSGVIITGEPGIGKSEISLELVDRGHKLIVDDGIVILKENNKLYGQAAQLIKDLLEVRGIGIINIKKFYGDDCVVDRHKVDYVVNLKNYDKKTPFDRLGEEKQYQEILGVKTPIITIPVSAGRNITLLVETAIKNEKIKENGYNVLQVYRERLENAK